MYTSGHLAGCEFEPICENTTNSSPVFNPSPVSFDLSFIDSLSVMPMKLISAACINWLTVNVFSHNQLSLDLLSLINWERVKALLIPSPVSVVNWSNSGLSFFERAHAFQCFQCTNVVAKHVQDPK